MSESQYQRYIIKKLKTMFRGCIILKNDPNYLQGFPDLLILYYGKWAALEAKESIKSEKQPNQQFWVDYANDYSYANFIYPENEEQVLDELQHALRSRRSSRLPIR